MFTELERQLIQAIDEILAEAESGFHNPRTGGFILAHDVMERVKECQEPIRP